MIEEYKYAQFVKHFSFHCNWIIIRLKGGACIVFRQFYHMMYTLVDSFLFVIFSKYIDHNFAKPMNEYN